MHIKLGVYTHYKHAYNCIQNMFYKSEITIYCEGLKF